MRSVKAQSTAYKTADLELALDECRTRLMAILTRVEADSNLSATAQARYGGMPRPRARFLGPQESSSTGGRDRYPWAQKEYSLLS